LPIQPQNGSGFPEERSEIIASKVWQFVHPREFRNRNILCTCNMLYYIVRVKGFTSARRDPAAAVTVSVMNLPKNVFIRS
jgi:hypothetical protein